jgi:hypothetical protein
MANPIDYGITETFGIEKKDTGVSVPGYFRLDWTVDDDEFPDYDVGYPPEKGILELSYFTVGIKEWEAILRRFEEGHIDWWKTQRYVRVVRLQTFPEAFDMFDRLLQEFVKEKITREELVERMLEASERHHP